MRTFIALLLPDSLRPAVKALAGRLVKRGADFKWVEEENFHVTLRFLGEIPPADLSSAQEALKTLASFPAFHAQLGEVGAFPSTRSPRVVWLGFRQGRTEMTEVAKALERELVERRFPPEEKPFHAHLTLGRQRSPRGLEGLVSLLNEKPAVEAPSFPLKEVVLFSSTLTPQGPVYRALQTVTLKEGNDGH